MKSAKKGTYIFLSIGVISSLFFCHSNADIYNMGFSIQRPQILAAVDRYPKPAKPSIEARYMKYYGSRRRNAEWQAGKILERMHQDAAEARKRERYAKTYLKLDQDNDGKITITEIDRFYKLKDKNRNNELDRGEIGTYRQKRMDIDLDGAVTRKEFYEHYGFFDEHPG